MPDLWKALGDVYGERDADAPPVPREPAASERGADPSARYGTAMPLDDDLAAALSAALVNAPTPGTPGAPQVPGAPMAPPVAPAMPAYDYTAPPAMPAPVAPMPPVASPAPAAPPAYAYAAPAAAPVAPPAADRVNSWIAEIDERNRRRDEGPNLGATQFPTWNRSDDDILPAGGNKRRSKR